MSAAQTRLTLALLVVAAAFAGTMAELTDGATASATSGAHSSSPHPPQVLIAKKLTARPGAKRIGSIVKPSEVGTPRVFSSADDGFALAADPLSSYPARTTDGGHVWRIDGPQFWMPAADAPQAVTSVGVVSTRAFYAFGSEVTDTTTNGGQTWWQTVMSQGVAAVVTDAKGQLVAYVDGPSSSSSGAAPIWQYVSSDGGRRWNYDAQSL